jgi:hypothetical protein
VVTPAALVELAEPAALSVVQALAVLEEPVVSPARPVTAAI